jgi:hypothetical protein
VYLAEAHLRQHDVGTVREMVSQSHKLATALHSPEHVGMATAMRAWVAWKEAGSFEVEELALQALEVWRTTAVIFPFHSICLWHSRSPGRWAVGRGGRRQSPNAGTRSAPFPRRIGVCAASGGGRLGGGCGPGRRREARRRARPSHAAPVRLTTDGFFSKTATA